MKSPAASPKVLVAPLNWGLGHATRCIPIIQELLRQGCTVLLAGEGAQKALLQREFPSLRFLSLPGYRVRYAASALWLAPKIVAQIPRLLSAVKNEQAWLQKVAAEEKIDAVVSDNRYGLHHPAVHSVFVTHQLRIKAPLPWAEDVLQTLNYRYLNCFHECWIPDAEGGANLAGALSHPAAPPQIPVRYLGPLSRFAAHQKANEGNYLLLILSGPEPQRTLLETIFLEELKSYTKPVVLVRGLPGNRDGLPVNENVSVFAHLPAAELQEKIEGAKLVIARCGYSTVMDLAVLQKRSILIPTPGQTEQEYLAEHLMAMKFSLCIEQKKFRLKPALDLAETFPYQAFDTSQNNLQSCIASLVQRLTEKMVASSR